MSVVNEPNAIDISCSLNQEMKQQNTNKRMVSALNNIWTEHKDKFKEWLLHKNISAHTKRDYFSALTKFFETKLVYKPMEFRNILLKDKEERGLRNLFNYFEDKEIEGICGYGLERWRHFVKIKKSGVVEIYVNDQEIKEAYEACPDDLKPVYRLLVYSGNRFTHIYEMLQKFDERNIIIDGEVAHYPTSSLSKGTKQTFHMFFPSSYIPELKKIGNLDSYDNILKKIQSGRVSAKTIRKWHLNKMIKEGITESIADFIQGRASLTVGSAHYLNKTGQAKDQYRRLIGKFPI